MDYTELQDDIWYQIFLYLDLKSIYTIEMTDIGFQHIFKRTKFWSRKIRKDFSHSDVVWPPNSDEETYVLARILYFDMYRLNHVCNICMLCFADDIPDYEWRNYLD